MVQSELQVYLVSGGISPGMGEVYVSKRGLPQIDPRLFATVLKISKAADLR